MSLLLIARRCSLTWSAAAAAACDADDADEGSNRLRASGEEFLPNNVKGATVFCTSPAAISGPRLTH
jgi:hypothetical protein